MVTKPLQGYTGSSVTGETQTQANTGTILTL